LRAARSSDALYLPRGPEVNDHKSENAWRNRAIGQNPRHQCQKNSSQIKITARYSANARLIPCPSQNAHLNLREEISTSASTESSRASKMKIIAAILLVCCGAVSWVDVGQAEGRQLENDGSSPPSAGEVHRQRSKSGATSMRPKPNTNMIFANAVTGHLSTGTTKRLVTQLGSDGLHIVTCLS